MDPTRTRPETFFAGMPTPAPDPPRDQDPTLIRGNQVALAQSVINYRLQLEKDIKDYKNNMKNVSV